MAASYSPQEREYYDRLFSVIDKQDSGVLPGQDALPFLMSSSLPQQTLGEIWALADPDNNGFLTKEGWYRAARVIGWMQSGQSSADSSLAQRAGPLPTFQGQSPPPPLSSQPTGSTVGNALPPLTAADRTKFTRIFVGCGPQNGLVNGDKARDVFLKSKLGYDKLGLIWNLADTQQRGSLDLPDFIIGMYLIQSIMANPALNLPTSLPPGTYEAASGGRPQPSSPIARQNTGPTSPMRQQYTGPSGILQPQRTGQSLTGTPRQLPAAFGSPQPRQTTAQWDVTPDAKATSDRFFAQLDTQNKGVIEGDVAVPFMLQSQLDEGVLANIWDLADIKHEGRLGRDEFAVAMHLINQKLAGQDVPTVLPTSLIPPALRHDYPRQEVTATSSTTKDLFDLFSDDAEISAPPPSVPAFTPQAFIPQPPSRKPTAPPSRQLSPVPPQPVFGVFGSSAAPASDLLGDEGEPARAVPDNSVEIGNKRNQLENTSKANEELTKSREDLERQAANSASQLEDLEGKLSSARVKHEAETKAVADLRKRVGEQTAKLKSLNADVITAESDLTAMKLEKDELGQALLRDKEEVRQLQRKMKDVEEEKTALKGILEKLKKETRQQKGLVTIAKKQLSTAESSRDGVQKEVREAERVLDEPEAEPTGTFSPSAIAAGVPLPATPRALSPTQTGASQRSNNPFDRLGKTQTVPAPPREEKAGSPTIGTTALAAAGAAAGVVAAGAATLYTAAKEVVAPEHHKDDHKDEDTDPFGAPRAKSSPAALEDGKVDPFGASKTGPQSSAFDDEFDAGFGDSFTNPQGVPPSHQAPTDFDAAFADFDKNDSTDEPAKSPVEEAHELLPAGVPVGIPKSAIPMDLRPETERTASTQALPPTSEPHSPAEPAIDARAENPPTADGDSSDEDEGPEDLETPKDIKSKGKALEEEPSTAQTPTDDPIPATAQSPLRTQSPPPVLSSPRTSVHDEIKEPKIRRSAPPPPAAKTSIPAIDDFDPFGAPAQKEPVLASAAGPKTAGFDDEDFDFSDLPPATPAQSGKQNAPSGSAFDDEFAGFDDEFDKPSTGQASEASNGMSKSYEMVSPNVPSAPVGEKASESTDEWGFGTAKPEPQISGAFSFDDAFGNDFEPTTATGDAAPQAAAGSAKPALPDRKESTAAQPDDIEDVKKLCAMGFPRTLVIGALDANGYDFQKALNVLIS